MHYEAVVDSFVLRYRERELYFDENVARIGHRALSQRTIPSGERAVGRPEHLRVEGPGFSGDDPPELRASSAYAAIVRGGCEVEVLLEG